MTYALHTQEYTNAEIHKVEQFQHKCIRQIHNECWYLQEQKPSRDEINKQYKQPTIKTWLQKLAITQHLRQTKNSWKIHTQEQKSTQILEMQWQEKWQQHKKIHDMKKPTQEQQETLKQHIYCQAKENQKQK